MNFKIEEITSWYKTASGNINAQLIIDTVNRSFHASHDQNILYIGILLIFISMIMYLMNITTS